MSLSLVLGLLFGMAVGGPLYYFYITHKAKRHEHEKRDRQSRSSMKKDEEQEEQEEQGK